MRIRIYQVLSGDCIHINLRGKNIITDTGFMATAKQSIIRIIEECINENQKIDLMIITHTDQDHISGMKALCYRVELLEQIDSVWINNPYSLPEANLSKEISFQQAQVVKGLLHRSNVSTSSNLHNKLEKIILGEMEIVILSPLKEDLDKFNSAWEEAIGSQEVACSKTDWKENIDELIGVEQVTDNSKSNLVSIAFLLKACDSKLLLLGDAHPNIIKSKLHSIGYSVNNPLIVDYVKLSHHGSKYNITTELLDCIDSRKYIISSNGLYLDKATIAMIVENNWIKKSRETILYFNYPESTYEGFLSKEELQKYHIQCIFAKQDESFVEINI